MTLPGETLGLGPVTCPDCHANVPLTVRRTCAPYLGHFCPNCGPLSRETEYYATEEEAEAALTVAQAGGVPEGVRV